jgi:hypothetical protein
MRQLHERYCNRNANLGTWFLIARIVFNLSSQMNMFQCNEVNLKRVDDREFSLVARLGRLKVQLRFDGFYFRVASGDALEAIHALHVVRVRAPN